ncbi:hypothetical protein K7432_011157 [Basidiobolus ranarum]|uniref:Uncharacterized protein n=1 Tax=Basidiobolus ranarum TaxID=34480 RepID=A0ABR2WMS1_9FUNG
MLFEVTIRMVALGKTYWKSFLNILDVVLMMFCTTTLVLLFLGCSPFSEKEELVDTVFLVIRNVIQFWRLITTVQKNKRHISAKNATIDFQDVRPTSMVFEDVTLSIPPHGYVLEEEEEYP